MKKLLVIGSGSDIAQAAIHMLKDEYEIIPVSRDQVDLTHPAATVKIRDLLVRHQPDAIVHCAGVFHDCNETSDFDVTFDVNVKSHWAVIRYYIDCPPEKPVKFIMIGSSTYKQGRRNFTLYAASRAAQHSMWQGASEYAHPNFKIGIIHPVRVNTKHVAHIQHPKPHICLEAEDVAAVIAEMVRGMQDHQCRELDYKPEA